MTRAPADAGEGSDEPTSTEQDEDEDSPPEEPLSEDRASSPPEPASEPPSKLRPTTIFVVLASLAILVGFAYAMLRRAPSEQGLSPPPPPQRRAPAEAIPTGAMLAVSVDMRALRSSPLAAPYLGGEREIPGLGKLGEACGFDPIASVDELVFAVPETFDADFGISATGGFSDEAVLGCAAKIIAAREGHPVVSNVGGFRSVRDLDDPASGEIAARPGGALLFGGGAYLRAMIDTADGALPSLATDSTHAELSAELAGFETARATLVLSPKQRQTVADEIARAAGRAPAALGAIASAALGVRLVDDHASLLLVAHADDPSSAFALARLLDDARSNGLDAPVVRFLGLGDTLSAMKIEVHGASVHVTVDVTLETIETAVDRALKLRALLAEPDPGPAPNAPQGPPQQGPPLQGPPLQGPPQIEVPQ
ncbi:MAG: hypothetical protein U0271_04685 [Polyangiaceae bacterium]